MEFTYPAFLWAMGLAIVPLWLHLSRRRKFRKLETGSLRFLREAQRRRRRRARWEEILLMLLRIAATLLLALLFARPTLPREEAADRSDGALLVMLDASGSLTEAMAAEAGRVAEKALRREGKGRDSVTLAQFSDRIAILDSIDDYAPRAGAPTRFDRAMDWALDRLLQEGSPDSGKLVLVAHFAATSLPETPPRLWPAGIEVELVPLEPKRERNAAVVGIDLRTPYRTDAMEIEARLHLPSDSGATVRLESEGYVEEKELPAGTNRTLFQFRPPKEEVRGWVGVSTEAKDEWPADDRRPFSFRWTDRQRVLLVDGDPGGTPFEGEAYFIMKALEASGAEHGLSPFAPEIAYGLQTRAGLTDLGDYDAVALCGVEDLTPSEAGLLAAFVETGGGLFIVIGDGWAPRLYASLTDAGLFPPRSSEKSGDTLRRIVAWDETHPALVPFDDPEGGDLGSLPWREGYAIEPDENWKAIARLDGDRPILLAKDRILVCPHPLNREWSDLPREPMFVPLVKSLFSFLTGSKEPPPPAERLTPGIEESREPGWYALPDRPDQLVAPAPEESRVTSADPKEIAAALGVPDHSRDADNEETREQLERITRQRSQPRPYELWPWIAVALLLLLIIEGILATARPRTEGGT